MKYASITKRLTGEGTGAWQIHQQGRIRQEQGDDIISLSIGDPDFDTPDPIIERTVKSLRGGRTHYVQIAGIPALRQAIADNHAEALNQPLTVDNVAVVPGAQNGIFVAAQCVIEAGDEIIMPDPFYTTYDYVVGATGAQKVMIPLQPEAGFRLNVDDVAAAITPRTRAIMLNTPHNPTGMVLSRDELEAIGEICQTHNLWVITDEVYSALCYDLPHISPASIPTIADRCITVSGVSKSYAMTGFRLGWVIGSTQTIHYINELLSGMIFGTATFVQDAALEALTGDQTPVQEMRQAYKRRRDLVCDAIDEIPGLTCYRPQGGVFALLNVQETGLTANEFGQRLLDEQGVTMIPGDGFGPTAAGYLRLSLTNPDDRLAEACQRLANFMQELACKKSTPI